MNPLNRAGFFFPEDEPAADLEFGSRPTEGAIWRHLYFLAWQGAGRVRANPLVAAGLVSKEGFWLGSAAHLAWGQAHGEASLVQNMMRIFGSKIFKEASLYCTLEPCAHEGKTPSCARILAQLPLKKVVYAQVDPNPLVRGKGEQIIKHAGILCQKLDGEFLEKLPFEKLTERFIKGLGIEKPERPFIALKAAISQKGVIGLKNKGRLGISSSRSVDYGHFLRRVYDALIVGPKTILMDDPLLKAKPLWSFSAHMPLRIAFDPKAFALCSLIKEHRSCRLLEDMPDKTLWILSQKSQKPELLKFLEKKGANFYLIPSEDRQGLQAFLSWLLIKKQVTSLMLEGGRSVWDLFLSLDLVDRVHFFEAAHEPFVPSDEEEVFWPAADELKNRFNRFKVLTYDLGQDRLYDVKLY